VPRPAPSPTAPRLPSPTSRRGLLVGGLTLLLLSLLFVAGRPWSVSAHDRYRTRLRELRVDTGDLQQGLLRARLGLPHRALPPAEHLARLEARAQALEELPPFLGEDNRAELLLLLSAYRTTLSRALLGLARYEAAQAELEAALEALPPALAAARAELRAPALDSHLEALTRASILFGLSRSPDAPARLREALEGLSREEGGPDGGRGRDTLERLVAAGRRVADAGEGVHERLAEVLELPLAEGAEALLQTYLSQYGRSVAQGERFRVGLLLASGLLALLIAWTFARLTRTSRALAELTERLDARVRERTEELGRANAELQESEARKAALLAASPDGVLALGRGGEVLDFNPAAERLFGLPRGEALGRPLVGFLAPSPDSPPSDSAPSDSAPSDNTPAGRAPPDSAPPDSAPSDSAPSDSAPSAWAPLREEVEAAQGPLRREVTALRADGSRFPAELTLVRVSEGGGAVCYSAVARDISERREVDRLKSEFVSTVSHELRTPLTSIRGSLGLIEGGVMGEVAPPVLELVRIARTSTDRLVRLINDILDLEKMESGRLELRPELLAPGELLCAAAEGLEGAAAAAGVRLVAEAAAGLPPVRADRDRLLQVLTNLASNAVKFSPAGAEVRLRAGLAPGGGVSFRVEDRGPGIPAEGLARLFHRFVQLDASDTRARGGTGLGLAISKAIVEQHGSQLEVESEVGRGSTFHFTLPPLAPPAPTGRAPRGTAGVPHVLVVEDEPRLASVLQRLLGGEGFRVSLVGSLAAARAQLAAPDAPLPDAVLLDVTLPDGDGLALLAELRARAPTLPVIVLSALEPAADFRPAPGGLTAWLLKPFEEAELLATLRRGVRAPGADAPA
jgi:signal transduction histidine kinase/CheY-like chemotaxis protein/tetratricopeptide (TPR) repeat protein